MMGPGSQSPEQRRTDVIKSYAISLYEFMEQFPAYTHSPSRTRKSAAWVTANSLVVITQVGDEFTVDETTTATQMAAWQFVRGRPEEATMGIRELGGVARYCRMVEVADWERLWAMIEQYPDFAQKFASG